MVIVAGHITVDPEQRESYLAGCMSVVEKARRADGCLDFVITADLLDLAASTSLSAGRRKRPSNLPPKRPRNERGAATRAVSVGEYDIADVRPLFGEDRA
jgi:hypothetical protein